MSTETELKLEVSARSAARVFAHPSIKARSKGRAQRLRLVSIYYDTPTFDLWRAQVSVRLRRTPTGWLQSVKWGGAALGGLHQRNEIEQPSPGQRLDVETFAGHPGLDILRDASLRRRLKPLFVTEVDRRLRMLVLPEGASIEASLDRGRIVSGTAVRPICELELELKAGTPQVLFDLAEALLQDLPVRPAHRSKAHRGYLLAGLNDPPVKAKQVELDPAWDIGRAAASLLASGLIQVQENADGMLAADEVEYLHQMRVGMRRLRSCLSALGPALPEGALHSMKSELKWLSTRLGAARDWDVFRTEALPAVTCGLAGVCDPALLAELPPAAESLGKRAGSGARVAWQSKRASRLLLDLARASTGGAFIAAHPALRQPVLPYSARLLEQRLERVVRLGKKVGSTSSVAELHKLRIAVKKLRYAGEFFATLYPVGKPRRLRARLVALQDCLGRICDSAVMVARVREAMPGSAKLVALVQGWSACDVHARRQRFGTLWREFRRSRPFWS